VTKEEIVSECQSLPLEDMAYVRRKLQDMVMVESSRLYRERMCKHPHIVDQRYGQMEDQVYRVCTACGKKVG
jgi:hypothetical protein